MARDDGRVAPAILTVAEIGLGVQGWFGPREPDATQVLRPGPTPGPQAKPSCLYTSSWNRTTGSTAWVDFIKRYPKRAREDRRLWKLWPRQDARLCVIASVADYEDLANAYPKRWSDQRSSPLYAADWAQVPSDAVHVTAEAVVALESRPGNAQPQFHGWNVESTAWFAWCFVRHEVADGP